MKEKIAQSIINISPDYLWGILALGLFAFLIVAMILQYHWKQYSVSGGKIFAKSIFWIVSVFLVLIATFAIVAFES